MDELASTYTRFVTNSVAHPGCQIQPSMDGRLLHFRRHGRFGTRKAVTAGMPNQIAQSGVRQALDGTIIEYKVYSTTKGRLVEFDNFINCGNPSVQVYQEFKGDYSYLTKPKMPPEVTEITMDKWVKEAWGQYYAITDSGVTHYRLEWYITDPSLRMQFAAALN